MLLVLRITLNQIIHPSPERLLEGLGDSSPASREPYHSPAKLPIYAMPSGSTSASPQYHRVELSDAGKLSGVMISLYANTMGAIDLATARNSPPYHSGVIKQSVQGQTRRYPVLTPDQLSEVPRRTAVKYKVSGVNQGSGRPNKFNISCMQSHVIKGKRLGYTSAGLEDERKLP